jgi:hypothetical protein
VLDYPKTIYHVMLMIAIVQTGYCVVRLAVFKIIGLGRVYAARRRAARRRQLPESPIQEVMMPYAFP